MPEMTNAVGIIRCAQNDRLMIKVQSRRRAWERGWLTDKSQIFTAESAEDAEILSGKTSAISAFSAVRYALSVNQGFLL